jgi:hypothetical protein
MPINNDILGIYKAVFIRTSGGGTGYSYIVESASRSITIDASPKTMMIGSPKTRIMDIGGASESISIQAPILIGGGSRWDGRQLASAKINEILDPTTASLPVLKSAEFTISESGGSVALSLEGDGDVGIGTSSFWVVQSNQPHPSLDPTGAGTGYSVAGPTRVARFYDFRAQIGNRIYFIQEASINVSVETSKAYFINPYNFTTLTGYGSPTVAQGGGGGTALPSGLSGNGISIRYGTPFPHIGINAITVTGKGKGAVVVGSTYADENIAGITTQVAGRTVLASSSSTSFALEVAGYDDDNVFGWQNLIPSGIGLSKAIINATNFQVNTGILTVDFDFMCYVA